jgi:DNA-binding MarR family transcriptional regulator
MNTEQLFNETRLLFHALKRWTESVHPDQAITVPMRAVLERLLLRGAATVPQMARARGVSRQHIQLQVDALLTEGFVSRHDNPAHRRSPLIGLTDKGRALIQTMRSDELASLSHMQTGVSDHAVAEAAQVLRAWREALLREIEAGDA